MSRRKKLYPGLQEVEEERRRSAYRSSRFEEEPDWTPSGKPNYEKFEKYGWDAEKILVKLNID